MQLSNSITIQMLCKSANIIDLVPYFRRFDVKFQI